MKAKNPIVALLPFWLFVFLFRFAATLHYTLMPVLGRRILPIWIVGIIVASAVFFELCFDVPAGFLMDRFGYVRVMRVSTVVFFLGALVLLFHFSVPLYLLTIFLASIGWLFFVQGINAYTLAEAPHGEGGRYMGIQHTFVSLGIVCSMFLLIFITQDSTATIGILLAIVFAMSLVALASTRKDRVSLAEIQVRHVHHSYYLRRQFIHKIIKSIKRLNPPASILAFQNLSGSIFYGMIWFVVPLIIATQQSSGILGLGLGIFDLAIVIFGAFLGRLADRYKKKTLIFMGLLLFSVTSIFIGFNFNVIFLVLGFLASTGEEMSSASLWSWLERLDTDHSDDGLINGTIILFGDIGWTIGPLAAGFLFSAVGPSLTIAIGAIPVLMLWIFAILFLRSKSEPELEPKPASALVPVFGYSRKPIRYRHKK